MAEEVIVRIYAGDNALLIVFAFYKPVRTLMVTYHRASSAASVATGAAANG